MPKITFTYLPIEQAKGKVRSAQKKGPPTTTLQSMTDLNSNKQIEVYNPYATGIPTIPSHTSPHDANKYSAYQPKSTKATWFPCENQYNIPSLVPRLTNIIKQEVAPRCHVRTQHQTQSSNSVQQPPSNTGPHRMRLRSIQQNSSVYRGPAAASYERERARSVNEYLKGTVKRVGVAL